MRGKTTLIALLAALAIAAAPAASQAAPSKKSNIEKVHAKQPVQKLQCVVFARMNSDITLRGDAWRWWKAAEGVYDRGNIPQVGSVLVFKQSGKMKRGHVAVVTTIVDERKILIDHANWGRGRNKGKVSTHVAVIDVSEDNDWSQVRVWYDPAGDLGQKAYPVYGFIYSPAEDKVELTMATGNDMPLKGEGLAPDAGLALDAKMSDGLALGAGGTETP